MSPASKSKSKDKKAGKEPQKTSSKSSGHANAGSGILVSGYNPLLRKFHTIETASLSSASPLHINGRFRNIDETDDHSGNSLGTGMEYDTVSNNDSCSGESEDHKEKTSHPPLRPEPMSGADNDKREKVRQKNEKKHQRQKERRAQELHERCRGFLMSRKLEALTQQVVVMGFSSEQATRALILKEGKIEESVVWLLEVGEEADKHKENNLDGGNLKIDISEELAYVADMETRYKCSKQEVERAIVACEGDLDKAGEALRLQKHDQPSAPPKPEETGDPPTVSNGKLSVSASQNSLRAQPKPNASSTISIQQRRDEKEFNYTKTAVTVGVPLESGSKSLQALRKVQPKSDWVKPQQVAMAADNRWPSAAPHASLSYSLASPLQATPPPPKAETRYATLGSELKNLQLGSVKEPVILMQRPQSTNAKQIPTTSISSSPPGTSSGWYPNNLEAVKPNGLSPHIPSTRSVTYNNLSSNQLYNQLHYQQHPQFVSSSGSVDSVGPNRGNGLGTRMGTSPTIAPASSLGLFSGLGSNGSSGSSSPVDWNTGGSMLQLDYTSIDWTLDRSLSSSRSAGMWQGMTSVMQNNTRMYDSYTSGVSARNAMRPTLANGGGVPLAGLQDGVASAETSAGGSREWASPFEEKDLFSLPRHFVSSPSL
ncbi:Protein transport protein like [Actinidia chinensis var. chinensis]|uniref:Protein transport protein like n=1 Tax=Actinidia chinensis var. chinensis TaxID=1590841 RepID=A0A2R6PG00_ACTCC|nr:Protein transport protein like [Actinidia chinensis var. chinensis]